MQTSGKEETTSATADETVETASPLEADATPPVTAKEDRYLGKTIDGRYVVEQLLGEGGMGYVYRGRHKVIDKRVAIKVLKTDTSRENEMTDRFLTEAKAASSIGNPHIVDVSDFGQLPDGATYFVMEYLDGKGLGAVMAEHKGKPMPVARVLHIGKQLAAGLAAAHEVGIVHRDLKPDNVMLVTRGKDRDFVKILDFGIAKVLSSESQKITRAGTVFGTPHYMSPEQAAGTPVDQRTDIYALGVILYELASGRVPFDAENFMGILTQHMYKAPVPILALVPPPGDVPPGLDAIVLKCLSKKQEQRYATMSDLVEDLQRVEQGVTPTAVAEMMSRSGGFNIPQDYFRNRSAMPEAVPAMPANVPLRPRWPLIAVIGALVGLLSFTLMFTIMTSRPSRATSKEPGAAPAVVPAASAATPIPAPSAVAPATRQVLITIDPVDAKLLRGGAPLVGPPFAIELKAGERVDVVATRSGYKDQPISLDDTSDARMLVKLQPVGGKAAGAGGPAPGGKPAGKGAGGGAKKPCDITDKNCDPWK